MSCLNRCARWVLLTPVAEVRSPIGTAPRVVASTLLVCRTSPSPGAAESRRPGPQLGRGHRQEGCQAPWLEVHADGPGPGWIAELQRSGGDGDHAPVGVLGWFGVAAAAETERLAEVDDEQRARHRRQHQ